MSRQGGPRRILYCESNTDDTIGGSHFCLLNLIENLDRSRYQPVTLFYLDHKLMPRFAAVSEAVVRPPHAPWRVNDAPDSFGRRHPLVGLPITLARRSVNFVKLAALVREEVRWLREQRIDLIHLNNSITRHHDWMMAAM